MKNFKINAILVASAISLSAAGSAWAQAPNPATDTFEVTITLEKSCTVVAGPDIDLGTQFQGAADASGSSTFTVTCTKSTPYNIGMTPANADTGGGGVMVGLSSTNQVAYNLYQPDQSSPWGNIIGTNTVGETGDGTAQNHTVWAKVLAAEYINEPDTYTDIVTISVDY